MIELEDFLKPTGDPIFLLQISMTPIHPGQNLILMDQYATLRLNRHLRLAAPPGRIHGHGALHVLEAPAVNLQLLELKGLDPLMGVAKTGMRNVLFSVELHICTHLSTWQHV